MKKSFLRYNDYLKEALSLKDAKYYTKLWNDSGMKDHLSDVFNNEYRIYLEIGDISLKNDIKNVLNNNNYEVLDYDKGLVKKIGDDKNITKIGKVLTKLGYNDLIDKFNADYSRNNKKINNDDYLICISRHPYDIAGMSTDRVWNSCMNLTDGENKHYVALDIIHGTIIAYLIKKDDKNINNPLSRILIKPFINIKDKTEIIYVTDNKQYPADINYPGFMETVNEWLNSWQGDKIGIYKLKCDLYNDGKDRVVKNQVKSNITDVDEIKKYLKNLLGLDKFKIIKDKNDNIIVDVNEHVNMSGLLLKEIPFKFRNIKGDFDVSNNMIEDFTNFPDNIEGSLIAKQNKIKSLENFNIESIHGDIDLSFNKIKKISVDDFSVCKLKYRDVSLFLNNNNIEIIEDIRFSMGSVTTNLYYLDLSDNIITYLNVDSIYSVNKLNLYKSISDYSVYDGYDIKSIKALPNIIDMLIIEKNIPDIVIKIFKKIRRWQIKFK